MKSFEKTINVTPLCIIVLICSLVSFSNTAIAQSNETTKSTSELSFEETVIDFGEIAQNSNGDRTFKFNNSGQGPLIISSVKTSCGCTVADFPKHPILAGESGEIKVSYDTKRIGTFSKTITVISNATEPQLALKIKGKVLKSSI